jgi:hypothetical protein
MKAFVFWQRWLVVLGVLITAFGIVMALFNATVAFRLFNDQIDPVFWGTRHIPPEAKAFRGWVYGAWGATVAGWGVFALSVALKPFGAREMWAWTCLTAGMLLWYILDTGISLAGGVVFNAAFNTLILILAAIPLAMTRQAFR